MDINCLFIIPPSEEKKQFVRLIDCSHEAKANYLWQPNDYLIISSYLKKNDNAFLVDGTCDQLDDKTFFNKLNNLKSKEINLIFFSTGSACYYSDIKYFEKIRVIFKDTTIVVLGDVFVEKNFRKDILNKDADAILYQPYNLNLDSIAKIRSKKINNELVNEVEGVMMDYSHHPFFHKKKKLSLIKSGIPRHQLFKKNYSWPFLTSKNFTTITTMWGCTYSCSYCTSGVMHPISRTNESILNEIIFIKKLGIKEIQFFDKVFGVPKPERKDLLKEIVKKNLATPFSCYFHPSMYDPEFLNLMKNAGCHTIIIGIDSVNLEQLTLYNRKVSQLTLDSLIEHADKIGINVCADFIIGLPHETEKDVNKTIEYSKKIKIDFASFNIAAPLPGSSFREEAINDGKINEAQLEDTLNSNFSSKLISSEKLLLIRKKANFQFYFRPYMIFRRLKRLKSIEHFYIQFKQMLGILKHNIFK